MNYESDSVVESEAASGTHSNVSQAYYDSASDRTLVETVLEALAEATGHSSDETTVCLYDSIDPDALNELFKPTRGGIPRDEGRVSFSVDEFAVTVRADGHVFVRRMG